MINFMEGILHACANSVYQALPPIFRAPENKARFHTEGRGGTGIPPPPEIWKLCHNCLNSYNRVYNTITKYSIIIGLGWIQWFLSLNMLSFYKTLVGESTHECTCCTHLHFPPPGKNPIWNPVATLYPKTFRAKPAQKRYRDKCYCCKGRAT